MEGALQWSISNLTGLCTARLPNGRLLAMFWLDRRVSRGRFAAAFDGFLHVTAISFENTQRNQHNERKMDLRLFVVSEFPLGALADPRILSISKTQSFGVCIVLQGRIK
jgi:hypothetical protein